MRREAARTVRGYLLRMFALPVERTIAGGLGSRGHRQLRTFAGLQKLASGDGVRNAVGGS
jgi:hypothetical protein